MVLIERDEALDVLHEQLAGALSGRGRVAMVSGAVGVGKSALLEAVAEQAIERGALAVTATGSPLERDLRLGVIGQLIQDAPLMAAELELALAMLAEGAAAAGRGADVDAQLVHALCTVLLQLSERCPLVLIIDDVHFADRESMICLAYLARRVRFARISAVFSTVDHGAGSEGLLEAELLRQQHCRRVHLAPLSESGATAMAVDAVGLTAAERFGGGWHAATGGNPLLITALVQDYQAQQRARGGEPPEELVPEGWYGRAVLACLTRGEHRMLPAARGLAALGTAEQLDRLVGETPEDVAGGLLALAGAGLVVDGRFRTEAAGAAVLAGMTDEDRMGLHHKAAVLAYERGAQPADVAAHLLRADRVDAPWVVPVLEDAARHALREGSVERAVSYLRLAWTECADERERTKITTMLIRAEWRINPAAPAVRLTQLTDALRRGWLRGSDAAVLARALLWHGRAEEAEEVLQHVLRDAESDPETAAELLIIVPWLRVTHPGVRLPAPPDVEVRSVAAARRLKTTRSLVRVLTERPGEQALAVEPILRGCHLDEMSMETVENALLALTFSERPDLAAPWCDAFIQEASTRNAPSRRARLAAIRAEIAVRQGDMPAAIAHARAALAAIPLTSWGVTAGGPLGSLMLAATATGAYDLVHEQLDQVVLDSMFDTRYGLAYLHARGRYSLATGHPALALRDLLRCGELMESWEMDAPGLIPWRAEAAAACLLMGDVDESARLVGEQLKRCTPETPRAHGMAMRVLAGLSELRHRPMLLRRAADLLRQAGDDYELARVLVDLADAFHELGEFRRSGMIAAWARSVASRCQAEPLLAALSSGESSGGRHSRGTGVHGRSAELLSEAEQRVAVLAATGHTNQEIAAKLYLTVSTVEQHLTRTYRKLGISRRTELPATLDLTPPRSGDPGVAGVH
ncbi:helix-turn-helix transcriptional regulator [Nonomuraea rosea]